MAQQHAKNAHPTKRGPGRYHKDGALHGDMASNARHGKRLRKSGLFITIDPIMVNVSPEQAAYLDRRYA